MNLIPTVKTAGFGEVDELMYDVAPKQRCGSVQDGVSFAHGGSKCKGWWCLEFADLEKIYLEARQARQDNVRPE